MSKKSEQSAKLLEKIELPHEIPAALGKGSLLQQGLHAVLLRHMPAAKSEAAVTALAQAFDDWNELRVCQAQEIAVQMAPKGARTPDKLRKFLPAATAVREYLQEIYQKTHALDLAELREDPIAAGKLVAQMPYLGSIAGTFVLWLAHDQALPVTPGLMRVLDRTGLMARTASPKKARAAMEPIVPKGEPLRFAMGFGYVAEKWCHARNPVCWECPLREECPHGKKVVKDWKVQQERLVAQRQKEEVRRVAQEAKDRAREDRERKRGEEARKRQAEKDSRAAERKLAAEKKAAEKRAAEKRAADKKAAEKKASEKKPPEKKAPEKKPPEKKAAAPKKVAAGKGAEKKAAPAKAGGKAAGKPSPKGSKPGDKPASEKKVADKKAAERQSVKKKPAAKALAKRPTTKSGGAPKPTTKSGADKAKGKPVRGAATTKKTTKRR